MVRYRAAKITKSVGGATSIFVCKADGGSEQSGGGSGVARLSRINFTRRAGRHSAEDKLL
jgi:hypothetical protein